MNGPPLSQPGLITGEKKIGSDLVRGEGDRVIILARRENPDWRVREFNRNPIFFEDRKYYLCLRKECKKPYAFRYELAPWPAADTAPSKRAFIYDEAFVAERDQDARAQAAGNAAYMALAPLSPLLGFLWSGVKDRLLVPLGFQPRRITGFSTFLTFALVVLDGIMFAHLGGGFIHQLTARGLVRSAAQNPHAALWDFILMGALFVDCIVRYNQVLRGDECPDGFLEWLLPQRRPKDS